MRQLVLRVFMLAAAVLVSRPAAANVIFNDGFEAGTSNWTLTSTFGTTTTQSHTGTYSLTDSPAGSYAYNTTYTATKTAPFSLVGASTPKLTFWYRQYAEYYDTAYWEASTDGITYTTLKSYPNNYPNFSPWAMDTISLASFAGQATVYIRFRFPTDSSFLSDGWYLDDISIDDGITAIGVTSPMGSVVWAGGTQHSVTWTYDGSLSSAASFRVDYSTNGGSSYTNIASGLAMTARTTSWTLPAGITSTAAMVRVQALDASNAVVGTGTSGTFTIDSTPPGVPSLSSPSNGACVSATPTFSWYLSSSETVTYTLTITPSTGSPLVKTGLTSSSYTLTSAEALTAAGSPYTWSVTAVDGAGNSTGSSTWSVFADSVAPGVFTLATPAASEYARTGTSFTWNPSTDAGCGTLTYTLYLDGTACSTTSTGTSLTLSGCYPTPSDGTHTWSVAVKDGSGNQTWCSEAPAGSGGRTVKIDNTPPTGTTLSTPAAAAVLNSASPTFTWTASTDAGSGGVKYQLLIDGSLVGTASTALSGAALSSLLDGTHTWGVRVTDAVGNIYNTPTQTFYVDTVAPAAFSLYTPADNGCVSTPTPSLCWYSASDSGGISSYQLFIDGAANATTANGTTTCQTPNAALTQGAHTWTVKATDRAGRTTASSQTRTVMVDWTAPGAFTLSSPADGASVASPMPTLVWTASPDVGGIARYEIYIDASYKAQVNGATLSWSPTSSLTATSHTWYVRAYDACGASIQSPTWTFTSALSCTPAATEICAGPTVGICKPGTRTCSSGGVWGSCVGQVSPTTETCNNLDDDCDGQTDEGVTGCSTCATGATRSCYSGASGTMGVGLCIGGTQTCTANVWGACVGQVVPVTEVCDNKDNDCDGLTDDGLTGCNPVCVPSNGGVEKCDSIDNDCNGQTDEGLTGCTPCVPTGAEVCDNKDNDCDGKTDEGADDQAMVNECYTAASGFGQGACKAGKRTCTAGVWGECLGQVAPVPEMCNGIDDDCNGKTDDGLTACDAGAPDSRPGNDASIDGGPTLASDSGCGCQTGSTGAPTLFGALGLALVIARRRRR